MVDLPQGVGLKLARLHWWTGRGFMSAPKACTTPLGHEPVVLRRTEPRPANERRTLSTGLAVGEVLLAEHGRGHGQEVSCRGWHSDERAGRGGKVRKRGFPPPVLTPPRPEGIVACLGSNRRSGCISEDPPLWCESG